MFRGVLNIYPATGFWYGMALVIGVFVIAFVWPVLLPAGQGLLTALLLWYAVSVMLLSGNGKAFSGERKHQKYLSLGDENKIELSFNNPFSYPIDVEIIDELPFEFQERNFSIRTRVDPGNLAVLNYVLVPKSRGAYHFGNTNLFITFRYALAVRKWVLRHPTALKVYPSVMQMRKFQLKVMSRISRFEGQKQIRRMGQSYEFEQIGNYTEGDDYRHINWKATSRSIGVLKVNRFEDEKSQPVYCLIDRSRNMKMPFGGLSLLDYAINASLVISNTALIKSDKAGLISFDHAIGSVIKTENKPGQLNRILNALYAEQQSDLEADYELIYGYINQHIKQRSLIFLFANFETTHNLKRVLPLLRKINHRHLLVAVVFQNSEILDRMQQEPQSLEAMYSEVIAEKFIYQKTLIVKEMRLAGIKTMLTRPEDLTIQSVNQYLEIKSSGLI